MRCAWLGTLAPTTAGVLPRAGSSVAAPPAACHAQSRVAGAVELCAGDLVSRHDVYDDDGADDPAVPRLSQSRGFALLGAAAVVQFSTRREMR